MNAAAAARPIIERDAARQVVSDRDFYGRGAYDRTAYDRSRWADEVLATETQGYFADAQRRQDTALDIAQRSGSYSYGDSPWRRIARYALIAGGVTAGVWLFVSRLVWLLILDEPARKWAFSACSWAWFSASPSPGSTPATSRAYERPSRTDNRVILTPRRPTDGDRAHRPFSDPLEPFNERPRRASRSQRRLKESARRELATRHIRRLSATHAAPLKWRLGIYGVLTVVTTLVGWRLTHWIVWAYDPTGAVSTRITALPNPGFYAGRAQRKSPLRPGRPTRAGGLDRPGWSDSGPRARHRSHLGLRPLLPKPLSTLPHRGLRRCGGGRHRVATLRLQQI